MNVKKIHSYLINAFNSSKITSTNWHSNQLLFENRFSLNLQQIISIWGLPIWVEKIEEILATFYSILVLKINRDDFPFNWSFFRINNKHSIIWFITMNCIESLLSADFPFKSSAVLNHPYGSFSSIQASDGRLISIKIYSPLILFFPFALSSTMNSGAKNDQILLRWNNRGYNCLGKKLSAWERWQRNFLLENWENWRK